MKFKKYIKESVEDMDKRCPECNTLLNDMGTCPKCDDGEEDYGDDELTEACSNYTVKKYGAWWYGVTGPDGLMLKDAEGKLKLFKNKNEAQNFADGFCKETTVDNIVEDISNIEKLKRAYPELNLEPTALTEAAGADSKAAVHDVMAELAKDDKRAWAKTAVDITDAIPDNFADEMFEKIKAMFSKTNISDTDKKTIVDASGDTIEEGSVEEARTLGDILSAIDPAQWGKKDPKFLKSFIVVILGIIAVIEPTPVVELITAVVMMLPDNVIANIVSVLSKLTNPVVSMLKKEKVTEELTNLEKLKAAYPELNFDKKVTEELAVEELSVKDKLIRAYPGVFSFDDTTVVTESIEETVDEWYDDDYTIDDVEEDHIHTALYGGDRT